MPKIFGESLAYCESLKEVVLPYTIQEIGSGAFKGCTQLESISFPEGLKNIDFEAFSGCDGLKNITLPYTLSGIGMGAFSFCHGLESINIPFGIEWIAPDTFAYCGSLKRIVLPSTVSGIDRGAFEGCSRLEEVVLREGLTTIGDEAFDGCRELLSLNVPYSVGHIGEEAFSNCDNLRFLTVKKYSYAEKALQDQVKYLYEEEARRLSTMPVVEKPDFVLSREADEITKSASEPNRQVETEFLEKDKLGTISGMRFDDSTYAYTPREIRTLAMKSFPYGIPHFCNCIVNADRGEMALHFYSRLLNLETQVVEPCSDGWYLIDLNTAMGTKLNLEPIDLQKPSQTSDIEVTYKLEEAFDLTPKEAIKSLGFVTKNNMHGSYQDGVCRYSLNDYKDTSIYYLQDNEEIEGAFGIVMTCPEYELYGISVGSEMSKSRTALESHGFTEKTEKNESEALGASSCFENKDGNVIYI